MEAIYKFRGENMTDAHRRMAMIPEGSGLIEYTEGRPPQLQFHKSLFFREFREIFENTIFRHRGKVSGQHRL
ncbi:MAG: hypothetical protein Ct9H300mP28_18830 [Pseudomonadota bacterium]|nr:MAG: hypothetical protein Ct9H300mP28_18830 [Pseudomonadota bacterium]